MAEPGRHGARAADVVAPAPGALGPLRVREAQPIDRVLHTRSRRRPSVRAVARPRARAGVLRESRAALHPRALKGYELWVPSAEDSSSFFPPARIGTVYLVAW